MGKVCLLVLVLVGLIKISFGQKPELVINTGHLSEVNDIWVNPDETVLISRSNEKLIFWELKKNRILREVANVKEFYPSPDNKIIVTIDKEFSKIDIWDSESGNHLSTIINFTDWCFSLSGKKIVTTHRNGVLGSWSKENSEPQYLKFPTEVTFKNCSIGLDDQFVFFSSDENNGSIYFMNEKTNLVYKIGDNISYWSLTSDGKYLILNYRNDQLEALELSSVKDILYKKQVFSLQENSNPKRVSGTPPWTVSPNGKYLVFWDKDALSNFVELASGRIKVKFSCGLWFTKDSFADTEGLFFSQTGNIVYRKDSNRIYDIDNEKMLPKIESEDYYYRTLSSDGKLLLSFVKSPKSSIVWDVINGKQLFKVEESPDYKIEKSLFSTDGNLLAIIKLKPSNYYWTKEYKISVMDLKTGKEKQIYEYKNEKKQSQFNIYGYGVYYGSGFGNGGSIQKSSFNPILLINSNKLPVSGNLLFINNGQTLIVGETNGKISICDTTTGNREILQSETVLKQAFFSADGKGVNIYDDVENYRFWDFQSGVFSENLTDQMSFKSQDEKFSEENEEGTYILKDKKIGKTVIQISKIMSCEGGANYKKVLCKRETAQKDMFQVEVWDTASKKMTFSRIGKDPSFEISNDGRYLSLNSQTETGFRADVWDINNGKVKLSIVRTGKRENYRAWFSADSQVVGIENPVSLDSLKFVSKTKYTVELWNIAEQKQIFFAEDVYYSQSLNNSEKFFLSKNKLQKFNFKTQTVKEVKFNPSNNIVDFLGGMFYSRSNRKGDKVVFFTSPNDRYEFGITFLWNIAKNELFTLNGHSSLIIAAEFSNDDRYLLTSNKDGTIKLWNTENGKLLLTLIFTNRLNWVISTPEGFFDGTPNAWKQLLWRFNNNTFDYSSVETYFNDFFYPNLLQDVLAGKSPQPKAGNELDKIDRRQPKVDISSVNGLSKEQLENQPLSDKRLATVTVETTENLEKPKQPNHQSSSEVRDLRLFRNGSLVKIWHGETIDEIVQKNKSECQIKPAVNNSGRKLICQANVPIVAGANNLTAYAFNSANVKSNDDSVTVKGSDSLKRDGTLYVLAVGINKYKDAKYNLNFAVPDVVDIGNAIKEQQAKLTQDKQYAKTEIITLTDEDATKANILLAIKKFSEGDKLEIPSDASPKLKAELAKIKTTQPEDALMIYYAGHGTSRQERFYLMPHNFTGSDEKSLVAEGISDIELNEVLEKVDAGRLLMVIDACQSGQALGGQNEGKAPMNSKGLAQLAYDKGMLILTAAQSQQAALEAVRIGNREIKHGLLTYALLEALTNPESDKDGNKQISEREWFDFAVEKVPQFQFESNKNRDPELIGGNGSAQTPRVFYRRETEISPMIVAKN